MQREEETELIRKAKKGDTAAFAGMIRRYQNLVYATAFQILKDTTLAEDVAQEAFVAALKQSISLKAKGIPAGLKLILQAGSREFTGSMSMAEPMFRLPTARRSGR